MEEKSGAKGTRKVSTPMTEEPLNVRFGDRISVTSTTTSSLDVGNELQVDDPPVGGQDHGESGLRVNTGPLLKKEVVSNTSKLERPTAPSPRTPVVVNNGLPSPLPLYTRPRNRVSMEEEMISRTNSEWSTSGVNSLNRSHSLATSTAGVSDARNIAKDVFMEGGQSVRSGGTPHGGSLSPPPTLQKRRPTDLFINVQSTFSPRSFASTEPNTPQPREVSGFSLQTTASPMLFNLDEIMFAKSAEESVVAKKVTRKGFTYPVRQIRGDNGHQTFDNTFLTLCIKDAVLFRWNGEDSHILQTDRGYNRPIPGGHHSLTSTAEKEEEESGEPASEDDAVADGDDKKYDRSFKVRFDAPGDYYFVCSTHKKYMRLHVQVGDYKPPIKLYIALAVAVVVLVVGIIFALAFGLGYGLQAKDFFLSRQRASSDAQYDFVKRLQSIITLRLVPWFVVGLVILFFVLVFYIVYRVSLCCQSKRQGTFDKGVRTKYRRINNTFLFFLSAASVVLLFVVFGLHLNMIYAINQFMTQLVSNVQSVLNSMSLAMNQVNYLVNQSETLFPDVDVPVDEISKVTDGVGNILNEIINWVNFGEDIGQAGFSALPILLFMCINIGFLAAAFAMWSLMLKYRRYMTTMMWLFACSLGVTACATGFVFAERSLMKAVYLNADIVVKKPADAPAHWGLANTVVSDVFSFCNITDADVTFVSDYVNDILDSINDTLSESSQKEFSEVFGFIKDIVPVGIEGLANYTDYIYANLNLVAKIIENEGDQVDEFFKMGVVPFLSTLVSVLQTFVGLSNCMVFRDAIAASTPYLAVAYPYNTAVLVFMLIIFVFSVALLVVSAFAAYAYAHPHKQWYEPLTGRYFRFRYCLRVHRKLLLRGPKEAAAGQAWASEVLSDAVPFMHRLVYARLLCAATSAVLFFECICLVLYNDVAGRKRADRLLRAISYIGCGFLLFLLGGFAFRHLLLRTALHGVALLCVLALLGLSIAQCVVGCVNFADCIKTDGFRLVQGDNGVYSSSCTINYAGHNLEIAVFGFIVALSAISTTVTLGMIFINEHNISAWMMQSRYNGLFSFLEKYSFRVRMFFADRLNVTRIYLALLSIVVIVMLVVLSIVDTNKTPIVNVNGVNTIPSVDSLVEVIDPTVECNGNSDYCGLRINRYMWATTHNAFSSLEDGFVTPNHYYNITRQLRSGYRSFMLDLHYDYDNGINGTQSVYLCHSLCLVGRQPFLSLLQEYRRFLERYPGQVLLVMLEQYVNSTDVARLVEEAGLLGYLWRDSQVPPNRNPDFVWPTLRQLINSGQRLIILTDATADSDYSFNAPDWMYYQFSYTFENDYTTTSVSEFRCGIGRGWCTDPNTTLTILNFSVGNDDSGSSSDEGQEDSSLSGMTSDPVVVVNNTEDGVIVEIDGKWYNQTKYELYLLDITNCTAFVPPDKANYTSGSDVYNTLYHSGNPPNVASKLSTVNHMITNGIGSPVMATQANEPSVVRSHVLNCSKYWDTVSNIVAFDYWSIKNPLGVVDMMNRNIVKYGAKYDYKEYWELILFGKGN